METISVRCNECGAPLRVGGGARFVTCGYCGADLEVRREGGALTTEFVRATESLARAASELSAHVRGLKLQDELSALNEKRAALEHEVRLLQRVGAPGSNEARPRGTAAAVLLLLGLAGVGVAAYFSDPLRPDPAALGLLAGLGGAGLLLMSVVFGTGSLRDNRRRRNARARVERVRLRLDEVRLRIEQVEAELENASRDP